jgi:predicted nucleic acid-binding protein
VKLFLDSSVVLAACGCAKGASRAVFDRYREEGWALLASPYVLSEVRLNIASLGSDAVSQWENFEGNLSVVRDEFVAEWAVVFAAAKDRPVLFSALAFADILLTLDRRDFGPLMGTGFYGLEVMKPGDFLKTPRHQI